MADIIPNVFLKDQADKKIDFVNDSMKVAFMTGLFDESTLRATTNFTEIQSNQYTAQYGYVAGGYAVTGKTLTVVGDEIVYNMDDIAMYVSGGNMGPIRYAVMYNTTNSGRLVYVFDFGEDKTVVDGAQFKIKIDANGLMKSKQV